MLLDENIRKEVTPKRVYSMLKLLTLKEFKLTQIRELIQPKALNSTSYAEVNKVYNFLKKIDFIDENIDGNIKLKIDKKNLINEDDFRRYFASKVFDAKEENPFFLFTVWLLAQGEKVFQYESFEKLVQDASDFKTLDKEFILAWRFWAVFIGLGFIHDQQFVINPYLRIRDTLKFNKDFSGNHRLHIKEFIEYVLSKCPELRGCVKGNDISYGLSFALRTLHDSKVISLNLLPDATDVWHLYKTEFHLIQENISEVTLLEV